jgi:AcrR family transcriptional regulator
MDARELAEESAAAPRALPRGPHRLPGEVVARSQRGRLAEAVAQAVDEKGYTAVTVADIVARAGVSRTTFYENFRDKEDCFLSSYDASSERHFEGVRDAMAADGDAIARVRAGVAAYLRGLAESPAYARAFLVEVLAVGPAGVERRTRSMERYVELMATWHAELRAARPEIPALGEDVVKVAVGGIAELVDGEVRRGGASALGHLEETLIYVYLSLFGLWRADPALVAAPRA